MRIDAHQHFWRYNPAHQVWMTDAMAMLRRDHLPEELQPLLRAAGFDGCIAVQARQMIEETEWLLQLADAHPFIKGVVGWVDLRSHALPAQLERFAPHPALVGVRHVVHDEPDDTFMLLPEFRRGISQLRAFDLAYDLLLHPRHLPVAVRLVREFPDQRFVLDHIAKPAMREGLVSPWREDLERLAECPNVTCKLSGLVTEAHWGRWRPEEFHRYLDIVVAVFGPERLMIGSDWPVCTLSGDYVGTMSVVVDYLRRFPAHVREAVLGGTCARVYGIPSSRS
ncbi:MAG: amidohydrolase family protein [Planctomycetaceae bacterium]